MREFKLELLSWNAQFGSKSAIFFQCDLDILMDNLEKTIDCPVWPWNLMDYLEKQ